MTNRPATLKQSDVTRIVKGVVAAGIPVERVVVHPDGGLEIIAKGVRMSGDAIHDAMTPLESWRANRAS